MIDIDNMIKSLRNRHVYIQMHNFPDPDAIASAFGLQYLLQAKGLASTIVYKGRVTYGSSYSLVSRLDIKIVEASEVNMTEETEIIIVDAQKGNANILDLPGDEIVCFDHHKTYEGVTYRYEDIRPTVGACASMIAEYMFHYGVDIDTRMATALLYGIKVDTANLTRGVSQLDLDMFYKLYNVADQNIIRELDSSVLTKKDLEAYKLAIDSIKLIGRTCFANVGYNCPESIVASVSDFMMKLDVVDNTIVYSIKDDGIKLSTRTAVGINIGDITNEALKGIGSGGGHESMSGGFVPYDSSVTNPVADKAYLEKLIKEIEKRFAKLIPIAYNS